MRLAWALAILVLGCGSPPKPASTAPDRPRPTICDGVKAPYPTWKVSEKARRDAGATFTSAVAATNRSSLRAGSAKPWGTWINDTHARVHPVFTDAYLASLCALERRDPRNDAALHAKLEIAVAADGTLEKIGVVEPSGQPSFDAAAVEALERAAPLPPPHASMLSEDGLVHLQWQFWRDESRGCAPIYTTPLILASPPSTH